MDSRPYLFLSFAQMAQPGYRNGLQNRYSWVQIPLCAYLKKIKIFIIIYIESDKETHSNKKINGFNLMDKIQSC